MIRKKENPSLAKYRDEILEGIIQKININETNTREFRQAPENWLKLLQAIEAKEDRNIIRKLLLSEGMPINVLSAEIVIDKIRDLLERALELFYKNTEEKDYDEFGHPKYSTKNIERARFISGTSVRMISEIPELGLLPPSEMKGKGLLISPPNRRHKFLVDKMPDKKHQKELVELIETAKTRIRECVRETRILTRANIDLVIADLLSILKYCEKELSDIRKIKEDNAFLREQDVSVEERLKELRQFQFPVRRKILARIYMQLRSIFVSGLNSIEVPRSVNELFAEQYTAKMASGLRRSEEEKRQQTGLKTAEKSIIEEVYGKIFSKRLK